jgi:hypothetical protein
MTQENVAQLRAKVGLLYQHARQRAARVQSCAMSAGSTGSRSYRQSAISGK